MGRFHHIQHQGQHNLHTDHASFYLHLPKKKEKYFTYKMRTNLTIWQAILLSLLMIINGTYSLKWDCGARIFHSPKPQLPTQIKAFICTHKYLHLHPAAVQIMTVQILTFPRDVKTSCPLKTKCMLNIHLAKLTFLAVQITYVVN